MKLYNIVQDDKKLSAEEKYLRDKLDETKDKIKDKYSKSGWTMFKDLGKSSYGLLKKGTTGYFRKNVKEYEAKPEDESKNAKKAAYGLGAGGAVAAASQIPVITLIPGVNIAVGTIGAIYGGVKGYQWLKDRKARKKAEKDKTIEDITQD